MNNNSLLIIGITGSTGSGKSYLTNNLIKKYSSNLIDKIEVDSYYKNLSHLTMEKRSKRDNLRLNISRKVNGRFWKEFNWF